MRATPFPVTTTGVRPQRATAWAVAALVTVLVACVLLVVRDERYFFYGDTQSAYYGWWYHLGEEVRAGRWPMLDPHAWRAGNLVAEGQWGLFSPLSIGIGLLATLAGDVLGLATAVKIVLVCLGALGMFLLARSYAVPAPLAYLAAVAAPAGGMTRYLDMPSWAAGLTIWALFPWVWWSLRRVTRSPLALLAALVLAYLLVAVGYVYGTIMLILLLVANLVDARVAGDRELFRRVLGVGVVSGLVALAVYLPGVVSAAASGRDSAFGGFGGKFSTDPLAMFTSVVPTASVHGTSMHLLPYAYLAWFLPVLLWVDLDRVRRLWRGYAGLLLVTVVTLLVVDGPARFGPLRWPLRLQTFLVHAVVLLVVVALAHAAVRHISRRRLALSVAWVVVAGVVAVVRAPEVTGGHVGSVGLVGGALVVLWWLARRPRTWVAFGAVAGAVTLLAGAWQHATYPEPPSPERNLPASRADYARPLAAAVGDVLVVGDPEAVLRADPAAADELLVGSAWYLTGHRVQNTYTAVSHGEYRARFCMNYLGNTCPELLDTLFTAEPSTGEPRVDLLGVSTLLLVRADVPAERLASPPPGWHVADAGRWTVTWVRDDPVAGAGEPVWSSPGTVVTPLSSEGGTTTFRVDDVPSDGGRVVLSTLAWPGFRTDVGEVADPVEGYLLAVDLPADAAGGTVTVRYAPPLWPVALGAWWLAVVALVTWPLLLVARRRRPGSPGRVSGAARSSATRRDRPGAASAPSGGAPTTRT